jgi:excisionase family DNA binding protein
VLTDELLSTAEVADLLGVSVPTVTRWARDGRLKPETKLPGHSGAYVFRRSVVTEWGKQLRTVRRAS